MGANIGEQLRDVRKRRGLTQRELAELSGVSLSLIRKLEQGEKSDTRLETARKLATALRVPTTRLMTDSREDAATQETVDLWEPVRQMLVAHSEDKDLEEPTVEGIGSSLRAVLRLLSSNRLTDLGAVLPALLRDAEALDKREPGERALRATLMHVTGRLLTQTRQFDAAEMALENALDASVDRLQGAAAANTQGWLLLRRGRLAEARALATEWADATEPRMSKATSDDLRAWGWFLLRVSAAGIRDNRPGEAEDSLRLARAAAVAIGREYAPHGTSFAPFGPVTVAMKHAENAMIANRPDRVLQLASRIPLDQMQPSTNNRNRHLLDVADAHARMRQFAESVEVLQKVQAAAPEWLPHQRYARDIMGRIVAGRRSLTPEMRTLADTVGLPL
ncbi:helix-turn-helix domain-containing protein [Yinghuangia sp. ASG 101]|uniref:helix-turn-helix domain-containing protein n=1 Tax=Yinghuangia sp. ASG 101 TaxID=2896848 RepID=UPI001E49FA5B|nr:helix-turn-helix domain-containing protein [Yinghuangia sp. ASG 101]UGQ09793.1 helix-turn-helix domain-containing protein [Yinghuangia sp. ASG 101]